MRRARRLLPALYLVVVATLAYAVVFLPGEVAGLRGDALSAVGYVTNWYLIFGNESYFEAMGRPSLLRHLWSLAVEEQFYLLWPPVVAVGISLGARRWRRLMFVTLAAAGGSALLMAALYAPDIDPSRIYYGTDTRATGLLFGAALAFVWRPGERTSRETCARLAGRGSRPAGRLRRRWGWIRPALLDVVGLGALAGLAAFCLRLDEFRPLLYKGGFVAVGLTTAVLIAVVAHPRARVGTRLLGWRPLCWVGERSYGIYLWHWPVYMVTRPDLDVPLDGPKLLALRLAVTVLLAHLSYRYVEQPVRHGALGRAWRRLRHADARGRRALGLRWAAFATPALALCVVIGVAVWQAEAPAPPAYLAAQRIHTATEPAPAEEKSPQNAPPPEANSPQNTERAPVPKEDPAKGEGNAGTTSDAAGLQDANNGNNGQEDAGEKAKEDSAPTVTAGPVSAIGDSVMLGSVGPFQKQADVSVMDAEVGMQVPYAIDVLRARAAAGQLGDAVIVHLGNNGVFTRGQFEEMMRVLEDVDRVIFVNVRVARAWETPNNRAIAAGVARHPNAELVDWYSASAGRPELFVADGVHLQPPGQRLYAAMIREQVEAG
jgi:peptidoglycan/LPS O-acetylase OafA/YrhL